MFVNIVGGVVYDDDDVFVWAVWAAKHRLNNINNVLNRATVNRSSTQLTHPFLLVYSLVWGIFLMSNIKEYAEIVGENCWIIIINDAHGSFSQFTLMSLKITLSKKNTCPK